MTSYFAYRDLTKHVKRYIFFIKNLRTLFFKHNTLNLKYFVLLFLIFSSYPSLVKVTITYYLIVQCTEVTVKQKLNWRIFTFSFQGAWVLLEPGTMPTVSGKNVAHIILIFRGPLVRTLRRHPTYLRPDIFLSLP